MTTEELKAKLKKGTLLVDLFDFKDGQECLIYKADEFEVSDNIIYIPDIYLNDINIDSILCDEDIDNVIDKCYTGNDFVKECRGHIELAEELFWFVDWQHPNIQDDLETYDQEEFEKKFGFSIEEFLLRKD